MNLRQTETGEEAKTKARAWYHNPETPLPQPLTTATQAPVSTQEPLPAPFPALFEPSAAERILARAGALQEVHGQMLSQEQIEAVAHEIGIKPEFVRLAIEQEKNEVFSPPATVVQPQVGNLTKLRVVSTLVACAVLTAIISSLVFVENSYNIEISRNIAVLFAIVLPLMMSFALGVVGQGRRWAVVSGVSLVATFIAVSLIATHLEGGKTPINGEFFRIVSIMIACSTACAFTGAQARHVASRRQTSRRSRRTGIL